MTTDSTPGVLMTLVSEFAGHYEDVPLAADVDIEAIRKDDPDPFFVSLPVCRVGAKSDKGYIYGEAANRQIVEQVNSKKPEGGLGHIKPENYSTEYTLPAWRAMGAALVDNTTWVKFYVSKVRADVRDHFRTAMRANALAGVSLWGNAGISQSNEVMTIDLKRIDIADPGRLGLPVAARPIITAHMAGQDTPVDKDDQAMDEITNTLIAEMKTERDQAVGNLAVSQTKIAEMETRIKTLEAAEPRAVKLAEMAASLGVEVDAVPVKVAEMQAQLVTYQAAEKRVKVEAKIAELVKEPLQSLRSVVVAHMGAVDTWPTDDDKIKTAVEAILDKPDVKQIAEMMVKAVGGGSIALGTADKRNGAPDMDKLGHDEAARLGLSRRQ